MSNCTRKMIIYMPGIAAIAIGVCGLVALLMLLPMLKVVIADSVGFGTSEGIEQNGGQLGPWRPATSGDVRNEPRLHLPVERYVIRDGWTNAYLHRVSLSVVRDQKGEFGDVVVHLDPHWRVGAVVAWFLLVVIVPAAFAVLP